jgi:hypothetical protein
MTLLKSFSLKITYIVLAGVLTLSNQACSKKTFTALNNESGQGNTTGASGNTSGGNTTAGNTSGNGTGNTSGGNTTGNTSGNTTGNTSGNTTGNTTGATGNTSGNTTGNTSGNTTAGTTTGGNTTSGTTSGGTTTSGTTTGGTTTSGTTTGGTTTSGTTSGGTTTGGTTTSGTTTGSTTSTPPRYCIIEKYKQPDAKITKKLDVLIVTDSSSSMDAERQAVANGITDFIAKLPADVNARFAVMLGHGPTSWFSGRLYKSDFKDPREKFVISTEDWSSADIKKWMNRKLRYRQLDYNVRAFTNNADIAFMDSTKGALGLPSDLEADGGEAGLFSLHEAFRDYTEGPAARYKSIQNLAGGTETAQTERNFFRPDAALAVIFISDENDLCYKDPSVPDDDNLEVPFYNQNCSNVTAETVLQKMQALRQSLPLYLSAIIYNTPGQVPAGLENGIGYGYNKITQISNGTIIDLKGGTSAIAPGLTNIGAYSSALLSLRHDFILKYSGADSTTIQAKADVGGNGVFSAKTHTYSSTTNTVHLADAGVAKSNVHIKYCLNRGAPLTPYTIPISNHLINTCPQTYQPNVVIEQD